MAITIEKLTKSHSSITTRFTLAWEFNNRVHCSTHKFCDGILQEDIAYYEPALPIDIDPDWIESDLGEMIELNAFITYVN